MAPADAILTFASAFPLIALGVVFLAIRPRRNEQMFFGAFAILWGIQVALANFGRMLVDAELHHTLLLVSYGFLIPASLFLVHFAAHVRPRRWSWMVTATMAAISVVSVAVLAVRPSLIVESVVIRGSAMATTFGPLAVPLVQFPYFGSFFAAIVLLYLELRRAPAGTARHRIRGLLLALALFATYVTVRQLAVLFATTQGGFAVFSTSAVRVGGAGSYAQLALFLAGGTILLGVWVHLFLRPPPPEGRDVGLLAAFVLPALTAVVEEVLAAEGYQLETLGFWRFVAVAVLVYTLARYQLFNLDLQLKRFAGPGVAGLLLAFGIPGALTLASGGGPETLIPVLLVEAVGVGASVIFHKNIGEALFPGAENRADYVHQRKLEVYRVALEDSVARGHGAETAELRELRVKLGVDEREHQLLVWVVAPQGQKPGETAAATRLEPGSTVLGRYRLDRVLGEGTNGRTFVAYDSERRQDVALKAVSKSALGGEAARILLRDARLAVSLSHANIMAVFDVAETPDAVILVMDFAEKGNLGDYLEKRGKLALPEAVKGLDEILSALELVHQRDIVHRALKPKNVLIEEDGTFKLTDFGAAKKGSAEQSLETVAAALVALLYSSPEQVRGRAARASSDLYSAAVLFHQMLTGKFYLPIAGKDDYQIRELIVRGEPNLDLDGIPPAIREFLAKALAKEPDGRFPDAGAMRAGLRAAASAPVPKSARTTGLGRAAKR